MKDTYSYARKMFRIGRIQAILLSLFWPGLALYVYQILHIGWNVPFPANIGMFYWLFGYFGFMCLLHILTTVFLCQGKKWTVGIMAFFGVKYFFFSIFCFLGAYKTASPLFVYPLTAIVLSFLSLFLWSLWFTFKLFSLDEVLNQKGFEPVMKAEPDQPENKP